MVVQKSLEPGRASAHHLPLADQLGVEFAPVKGEVDVKVDAVEGPLRRVLPLEVFLQILP